MYTRTFYFLSDATHVTHSPEFCSVQKTYRGIPAKNLVSSRSSEVVYFCGVVGNCHFVTPPPPWGGIGPTKGGSFQGGGGMCIRFLADSHG